MHRVFPRREFEDLIEEIGRQYGDKCDLGITRTSDHATPSTSLVNFTIPAAETPGNSSLSSFTSTPMDPLPTTSATTLSTQPEASSESLAIVVPETAAMFAVETTTAANDLKIPETATEASDQATTAQVNENTTVNVPDVTTFAVHDVTTVAAPENTTEIIPEIKTVQQSGSTRLFLFRNLAWKTGPRMSMGTKHILIQSTIQTSSSGPPKESYNNGFKIPDRPENGISNKFVRLDLLKRF
jgi:hypothetical protein